MVYWLKDHGRCHYYLSNKSYRINLLISLFTHAIDSIKIQWVGGLEKSMFMYIGVLKYYDIQTKRIYIRCNENTIKKKS